MALLDFKALIHWKWFTWYQPVYDSIMLVFGYFENRFWFQHIHTPIRFCNMEQPKKLKETNYTQSHIKCTTSRTEFAWSFSHFFFQQFAVFCCTIQLIQFRREKKTWISFRQPRMCSFYIQFGIIFVFFYLVYGNEKSEEKNRFDFVYVTHFCTRTHSSTI